MAALDLSQKRKVAFVCSGGAVKAAAFHVGVAMALEEKGFRFLGGTREGQLEGADSDPSHTIRVYVGSSAGSLVTTLLAQGGKLKDLQASFRMEESSGNPGAIPRVRYWEMLFPRMRSPKELLSWDNFLLGMVKNKSVQSPFTTDGISNYLRNYVIRTDRFSDLEADLFIVANEVNQSKKVIFGKYKSAPIESHLEYRNDVSISDGCAASMALPPIYHPYPIQIGASRRDFFDGEIREPMSEHIARDTGCDLIICSYTHQPIRMPLGQSLSTRGLHQVTLQAIYQAIEQKLQFTRAVRARERGILDKVRRFLKDKQISEEIIVELLSELETRMSYKSNVDYIYIHPRPGDVEMFLAPHFSLDQKTTQRIVRKGYMAALTALRGLKPQN